MSNKKRKREIILKIEQMEFFEDYMTAEEEEALRKEWQEKVWSKIRAKKKTCIADIAYRTTMSISRKIITARDIIGF